MIEEIKIEEFTERSVEVKSIISLDFKELNRLQHLKILFVCLMTIVSCFIGYFDLNPSMFCPHHPNLASIYAQFAIMILLKLFLLCNFVYQITHYWSKSFILINFLIYFSTGSILSLSFA